MARIESKYKTGKKYFKRFASATNLTEYQVYDFLNHEKQKIKKRNRMSVNNI